MVVVFVGVVVGDKLSTFFRFHVSLVSSSSLSPTLVSFSCTTLRLCIQTKYRDSVQNTAAAADSASDAQLNGPTPMDTSSPAPLTATTTTTTSTAATPTQTAPASHPSSISNTPATAAAAAAATTTASASAGQPAVASSDEPAGAVSTTTTAPQTTTTTSASSFTTTTTSSHAASTTTTAAAAAAAAAAATTVAPVTTATSGAPTSVAVSANGLHSASAAPATPTANTTATVAGNPTTNPQQPPTTTTTTTGGNPGTGLPPPQSKTGTTDKGGLPKAMIKPNVLTHVIEGFVILEANEPFPNHWQRGPEWDSSDEPPKKRAITDSSSPISPSNGQPQSQIPSSQPTAHPIPAGVEMGNCEICGKPEHRSKMKRKRFCSVDCARAAKQNSTDQVTSPSHNGAGHEATHHPTSTGSNGLDHPSVTTTVNPVAPSNIKLERMDSMDQPSSHHGASQFAAATPMDTGAATIPVVPAAIVPSAEDSPVIVKWSVQEVCDFIKNLPGCSDYAEDFAIHEIDGQALLLLKENHLVNTMGMKLGPALKIVAKIHSMIASVTAEGQQQQ